MRLLSLDYDPVYGDDCDRDLFASDVSAFDSDVVIWDPSSSLSSYYGRYFDSYKNLPSLSDDNSVRLQADIKRRRDEFSDFLKAGRTLIVSVCPPQKCYVSTGEKRFSGTGKNSRVTNVVSMVDLWEALPQPAPGLAVASGNRFSIDGSGAVQTFLKKHKALYRYDAVMTSAPGKSVASVTGTDRVISSLYQTEGGGTLILLPAHDLLKTFSEKTGKPLWKTQAADVFSDLLNVIESLDSTTVESRPSWAKNYTTEEQIRINQDVLGQQKLIEDARAQLAHLQQLKDASESKDQLYLGTGRALELEVRAVLELLGGVVTEPEPGRDDWKVAFEDRTAVVEVKGVSKSAAEKHAAQLEKWVSGEMEDTGVQPKGLLVVNTWRETELSDRTEPDFPAQMIPYCTSREHCLITGLQLFCIRTEIESNPDLAAVWRERILATSGILQGAEDWASILVRSSSDKDDEVSNDG